MAKKNFDFRTLNPDEVGVRIASFTELGVQYLIYKLGSVDAQLLDETVGPMNWSCDFSDDLKKCSISIWDEEKKCWVTKADSGDISSDAQCPNKGLATDAFKRAGTKWGIGKELKMLPRILVACPTKLGPTGFEPKDWKHPALYMPHVTEMVFTKGRKLRTLEIRNGNDDVIFSYSAKNGIADVDIPDKREENEAPVLDSIPALDFEVGDVDIDFVDYSIPPVPVPEPQADTPDPSLDLEGYIRSKGGQI